MLSANIASCSFLTVIFPPGLSLQLHDLGGNIAAELTIMFDK